MYRLCYWQVYTLIFSVLIVSGCGGAPTSVSSSTPVTSTTAAPKATESPPTVAPTQASVKPQPNAKLAGAIEIGEKAKSATINMELSADGAALSLIGIMITGPFKCSGGASAGEGSQVTNNSQGPFPIKEGAVAVSLPNVGDFEGRFTAPTEASGTITIKELAYLGKCDFGTLKWSAKAP
jgi:hypothetical protein